MQAQKAKDPYFYTCTHFTAESLCTKSAFEPPRRTVINLSQWKHPDFAIVDVEASWIMCRQAVPYKTTVIKTGLNYRSVNCYSFCLVRVTADGRKVPMKHTPFFDKLSTCSAHERL